MKTKGAKKATYLKNNRFSNLVLVAFAAAFAGFGGYFIFRSSAAAPAVVINQSNVDASQIPQTYLDAGRTLNVLFNHQSVGYNIIEGLDTLASSNPARYSLVIGSSPSPTWFDAANNGLGEFTRGNNYQPLTKINGFNNLFRTGGYASHVNAALMKFCFVDMNIMDPNTLWTDYRNMMTALQTDFPNITFVWTTVPLENYNGHDQKIINDAVRSYVQTNGSYLFDIAAIETYSPAGQPTFGPEGYPILNAAYDSGDGGHLNATGEARMAKAWWNMTARLAGWSGGSSSDMTPPVISNVSASNITSSSARVIWTTDEPADSQVEYGLNTSYGSSTTIDSNLTTTHSVNVSGLSANTIYHYRVKSKDAAANLASSSDFSFTTSAPPPDTTPPTVSITSPGDNSIVVGSSIAVSANASDNVGIAGVQFKLDGTNLGVEDTTSPYSVNWNTTLFSTGSHSLTAVARDAAGNSTTSSAITVTVDNTAPSGSITSPTANAILSGTITIDSNSADVGSGVASAQFQYSLAGAGSWNNISTDITAPYSVSWNTAQIANGSYDLRVVTRDIASNSYTSPVVTINTSNSCPSGDANGDCQVTIIDLSMLLSHYNINYSACDFNSDGTVNVFDMSILLSHYGT